MITTQHIQEDLSRAYVQAVAAKTGVLVSINGRSHDYGVDGTFHQVSLLKGKRLETGFNLDFQCKASTQWDREEEHIVYDLESQAFNGLVARSKRTGATPFVLILMCLSDEESDWFELDEDQLLLRKCCYWHRLTGEETDNTTSRRIRIPRHQVLQPTALASLLDQVERGILT
jgi:hypothetical protein